jgi:hypothetical protein
MLRAGCRRIVAALACALVGAIAAPAQAKAVKITHTAGRYTVELDLLDAEAFGTPMPGMPAMGDGPAKMVMVAKGGADPVPMDAPSHPNHHLVVHVYDATSHEAVADATVTISFTPLDASGKAAGTATEVPVVVMEASGKGAASTHYGNNVTMPAGRYRADVTVNGTKTAFRFRA